MSNIFGFAIESLVAILLLLTILYCVRLNNQLRMLKADEQSLKATIGELMTATEIAERAIKELKVTAGKTDQTLGLQLSRGDTLTSQLDTQIAAGDALMRRLAGIVAVSRPAHAADAVPAPQPEQTGANAVVAAAAAFAERARLRMAAASKAA